MNMLNKIGMAKFIIVYGSVFLSKFDPGMFNSSLFISYKNPMSRIIPYDNMSRIGQIVYDTIHHKTVFYHEYPREHISNFWGTKANFLGSSMANKNDPFRMIRFDQINDQNTPSLTSKNGKFYYENLDVFEAFPDRFKAVSVKLSITLPKALDGSEGAKTFDFDNFEHTYECH
jgi:hypothetical protein